MFSFCFLYISLELGIFLLGFLGRCWVFNSCYFACVAGKVICSLYWGFKEGIGLFSVPFYTSKAWGVNCVASGLMGINKKRSELQKKREKEGRWLGPRHFACMATFTDIPSLFIVFFFQRYTSFFLCCLCSIFPCSCIQSPGKRLITYFASIFFLL